ncbi:hypothetical protein LCGC14_1562310 [marine sediment metagenome]|uniref:Uncharacterized protein n=1 Tax=marine sediment metagenome TaxID=412755 RepID=A0A0F9LMR4_9ZZZZ
MRKGIEMSKYDLELRGIEKQLTRIADFLERQEKGNRFFSVAWLGVVEQFTTWIRRVQ